VRFVRHLAFAHDPLPVEDLRLTAQTVEHDQHSVEISLYERAGPVVSEEPSANNPVTGASDSIKSIPTQAPGQYAQIDILIESNEVGLLVPQATERSTRKNSGIRVASA
jgi:hypothetical protein